MRSNQFAPGCTFCVNLGFKKITVVMVIIVLVLIFHKLFDEDSLHPDSVSVYGTACLEFAHKNVSHVAWGNQVYRDTISRITGLGALDCLKYP